MEELLGFLLRHRHAIPAGNSEASEQGRSHICLVTTFFRFAARRRHGCSRGRPPHGIRLGGFFWSRSLATANITILTKRIALALGAALVLWPLRALPKPGDIIGEFSQLEATEDVSLKLYNDSLEKWKAHQLSAGQFADVIDKQILPNGRRNATL